MLVAKQQFNSKCVLMLSSFNPEEGRIINLYNNVIMHHEYFRFVAVYGQQMATLLVNIGELKLLTVSSGNGTLKSQSNVKVYKNV